MGWRHLRRPPIAFPRSNCDYQVGRLKLVRGASAIVWRALFEMIFSGDPDTRLMGIGCAVLIVLIFAGLIVIRSGVLWK